MTIKIGVGILGPWPLLSHSFSILGNNSGFTAAQLAQTSSVAGAVNDGLRIQAFDGSAWSVADTVLRSPFHISAT